MDQTELKMELETAARLCEGLASRVVILAAGIHYEIRNVIPMGPVIVLEAGEEAEAPHDPMMDELESDDPAHLRIVEDQPAQEEHDRTSFITRAVDG